MNIGRVILFLFLFFCAVLLNRFYIYTLCVHLYVCVSFECYLLSISEHKMPKAFGFEPKMIELFTLSLCFYPLFSFCVIFACLFNNNDDLVLHESSVALINMDEKV